MLDSFIRYVAAEPPFARCSPLKALRSRLWRLCTAASDCCDSPNTCPAASLLFTSACTPAPPRPPSVARRNSSTCSAPAPWVRGASSVAWSRAVCQRLVADVWSVAAECVNVRIRGESKRRVGRPSGCRGPEARARGCAAARLSPALPRPERPCCCQAVVHHTRSQELPRRAHMHSPAQPLQTWLLGATESAPLSACHGAALDGAVGARCGPLRSCRAVCNQFQAHVTPHMR